MAGPQTRQKLQPRHVPRYNPAPMPEYETDPRYKPAPMPEYGTDPRYKPAPMPEYGFMRSNFQPDQSGLMLAMANSPAVNKMKNIYSQVDPFFPNVDIDDQQIGYDFDKNLWGGTLGFGGEYDMEDDEYNAYINWGIDW